MNVAEAQAAIEVLKAEIERYEGMKQTAEAWGLTYREREAAREARDYLYAAHTVVRNMLRLGKSAEALQIVEEVEAELHLPDSTQLKSVWVSDVEPRGEQKTLDSTIAYRRNKVREMFDRRPKP